MQMKSLRNVGMGVGLVYLKCGRRGNEGEIQKGSVKNQKHSLRACQTTEERGDQRGGYAKYDEVEASVLVSGKRLCRKARIECQQRPERQGCSWHTD